MLEFDDKYKKAVALKYDDDQVAPIVIAAGMGYTAEKIIEIAAKNQVPVYEDASLATMLSRLEIGTAVPEELYRAIVDIYVYFLNFSDKNKEQKKEEK